VTYRPCPRLIACRLAIEFFRVTLPATILVLTTLVDEAVTLYLAATLSPLEFLALSVNSLVMEMRHPLSYDGNPSHIVKHIFRFVAGVRHASLVLQHDLLAILQFYLPP
jgi:hypothetical protein